MGHLLTSINTMEHQEENQMAIKTNEGKLIASGLKFGWLWHVLTSLSAASS